MEYSARDLMRLRKPLLFVLLLLFTGAPLSAAIKDPPRSFSLSTSRTFAPGESVKIQLYAKNVPALEFRVYRVKDAEKFFSGLKDLHSFGVQSYSPGEQIDERTWIERLHDLKADLWWRVRHFFRLQFSDDARDSFRESQGKLGKRSQVVGATEFAQIPLLNESQLVARWKLITPPAIVSETQQLPIDGLASGVYLIEATDGTYKAYTVAIVTSIAIVERAGNGQANLYVADRKTGAPIDSAAVSLWTGKQLQSSGKTGGDGLATLTMTVPKTEQGAEQGAGRRARHVDRKAVQPDRDRKREGVRQRNRRRRRAGSRVGRCPSGRSRRRGGDGGVGGMDPELGVRRRLLRRQGDRSAESVRERQRIRRGGSADLETAGRAGRIGRSLRHGRPCGGSRGALRLDCRRELAASSAASRERQG